MEEDLREIDENVMMHAMFQTNTRHEDGRQCAYHSRLDMWISITDSLRRDNSMECLRDHSSWRQPWGIDYTDYWKDRDENGSIENTPPEQCGMRSDW